MEKYHNMEERRSERTDASQGVRFKREKRKWALNGVSVLLTRQDRCAGVQAAYISEGGRQLRVIN